MPAFRVRNLTQINDHLGKNAIEDGFVQIPIKTFIDYYQWQDDLGPESCHYAVKLHDKLAALDSTYQDVLYTRDLLAKPFA